jgi:hypothetical protein
MRSELKLSDGAVEVLDSGVVAVRQPCDQGGEQLVILTTDDLVTIAGAVGGMFLNGKVTAAISALWGTDEPAGATGPA